MSHKTKDGLSLLVGAGIGVGVMYFLDPSKGAQRRQRVGQMAGEQLGGAMHAVTDGGRAISHSIVEHARDLASHLPSHLDPHQAYAAGQRLHQRGQQLADSASSRLRGARGYVQDAASRVSNVRDRWMDNAQQSVRAAADHAADKFGYERQHSHVVGQSVCALSSLALGAGIWYLFDPRIGPTRRARIMGVTRHWIRETGQFARATGKYISGKLQGAVAEGRTHLANPPVSDEKLREHIRAKLGHWIDHAGAVDVSVSGGSVTLRGNIPATEIPKVTNGVLGLRGVANVDNQLASGDPSLATT